MREKSQQLSAVTTQFAVRGQSLTRTLCKKLEQLRTDPVRLRAQFDDAKRQRDGTDQQGMEEVEKAICELRNLSVGHLKRQTRPTR
jgi:hypothetical protein